jgi:PEP-CTERM motif
VLDQQTVSSTAPLPGGLTFDWSNHIVALDALGATDGKVTLLIDLTAGGYGAFDNILIAASDTAGEIPGGQVPEPSSVLLLAGGLVAAAVAKHRARARA